MVGSDTAQTAIRRPEKSSALFDALNSVDEDLAALSELQGELMGRLQPITVPTPCSEEEKGGECAYSHLTGRVIGIKRGIIALSQNIRVQLETMDI